MKVLQHPTISFFFTGEPAVSFSFYLSTAESYQNRVTILMVVLVLISAFHLWTYVFASQFNNVIQWWLVYVRVGQAHFPDDVLTNSYNVTNSGKSTKKHAVWSMKIKRAHLLGLSCRAFEKSVQNFKTPKYVAFLGGGGIRTCCWFTTQEGRNSELWNAAVQASLLFCHVSCVYMYRVGFLTKWTWWLWIVPSWTWD